MSVGLSSSKIDATETKKVAGKSLDALLGLFRRAGLHQVVELSHLSLLV